MIKKDLILLQDLKYKEFIAKIIPNIDKENIIGIRSLALKTYSKELFKNENLKEKFLNDLPHKYLEENNLHILLLNYEKNFEKLIDLLEKFLPYMDNWSTTDSFSNKIVLKNLENLIVKIKKWIKSDKAYVIRFAIILLLKYYLDDKNFKEEYLQMVANVKNDDYYVKMMIAWYFSMVLVKQYEKGIVYIENKSLDIWIHNKAIQKSIESRQISIEKKEYLKTLKRKKEKND